MAYQCYVTIKGTKQGQFKGEVVQKSGLGAGKIAAVRYASGIKSPRDIASGQATGKRQWAPITITKQWGAASPQLMQALVMNETLESVLFEFVRADAAGKEVVHYTVTLQNASVASINSYLDLTGPAGTPYAGHELEDIELTFASIQVQDKVSKASAADSWQGSDSPSPVMRPVVKPVLA